MSLHHGKGEISSLLQVSPHCLSAHSINSEEEVHITFLSVACMYFSGKYERFCFLKHHNHISVSGIVFSVFRGVVVLRQECAEKCRVTIKWSCFQMLFDNLSNIYLFSLKVSSKTKIAFPENISAFVCAAIIPYVFTEADMQPLD